MQLEMAVAISSPAFRTKPFGNRSSAEKRNGHRLEFTHQDRDLAINAGLHCGGFVRQRASLFPIMCGMVSLALLASCGGKGGSGGLKSSGGGGALALTVSASATCGGSGSSFSHIFLTIRDVQGSPNANATPGDGSFVDVTPGLSSNPQQIDLMGTPNQCFLNTLGSNLSLNPGSYAQLRVVLASDGTVITGNQCGAAANCVIRKTTPLTPQAIQVGSETTTGIKIPSSNLAGGSFTVVAGQQQNLNLNFDACASIVASTGNQFRLEAVLFAGDTGVSSPVVNGQLVDSATAMPVPNGQFTVALEQLDNRSIDRVMLETATDAQGNFQFCPVPSGHYDVVASGMRTDTNATFGATAALSVPSNTNLGQVPMTAVSGNGVTAAALNGSIDISGATPPGSIDVTLSALQLIAASGLGGNSLTVPLLNSPSATASVATPSGCTSGTQCAPFSIEVPAATPVIGQFNSSGTRYTPSSGQANYSVEGDAFMPLTGGASGCNPSFQSVPATNVTPGSSLTLNPLTFSGC